MCINWLRNDNWIEKVMILIMIIPTGFAYGEVGDPCSGSGSTECATGEVCVPGRLSGDAWFCTRSCNETNPCPEEFVCEDNGGAALCNTEVELSGLGEPCEPACSEGLLCVDDGVKQYCSIGCTLPGSCPEGFRCQPGALNACALTSMLPSVGEPCQLEEGCSGENECLQLPHRTLPYCTYNCSNITCPPFMVCEGEEDNARCTHLPYARSLGEECVTDAYDPVTIGCVDELSCEKDRDRYRCTLDCDRDTPCPDGFGCVERPDQEQADFGRCLPDTENEPRFQPREESIPNPQQNPDRGDEGGESVPGDTIGNSQTTRETSSSDEEGCQGHPDHSPPLWKILIILFALTLRRYHQGRLNPFLS